MDGFLSFLTNYKIIDMCIGVVGIFGLVLIFDRFKALYFTYALPVDSFMKQVMNLIEQDKVEEAITFCGANDKKPLALVVKRILEKSDRDDQAMEQALDIASAEVGPKLMKSLGHLAMVSNVVTLIGLLGTVIGLITAFRAVSFADVSQKQTLLAEGISIAMTATMMGLIFAIPTMICYSFLHSKQGRLFSEIDEHSQKVIEALRMRIYMPFKTGVAYPTTLNADSLNNKDSIRKNTPPPSVKVS
jgi:biopolymer transport protein ExbB/TolQ